MAANGRIPEKVNRPVGSPLGVQTGLGVHLASKSSRLKSFVFSATEAQDVILAPGSIGAVRSGPLATPKLDRGGQVDISSATRPIAHCASLRPWYVLPT